MDSVSLVNATMPIEVRIGRVTITDPEKVKKLFEQYFSKARDAKQVSYSDVARAIRNKESIRFNDGEDSILVVYG